MIRTVVMFVVLVWLAWLLIIGVEQTARPACPVPVCIKV